MTDISMLPGRLLIQREPDHTMSNSGLLHLPDVEHVRASLAYVHLHEPLALEENLSGRRVVVLKWNGKHLELSGAKFEVITEGAVLAILEDDNEQEPTR